jgi:hypothetical protein
MSRKSHFWKKMMGGRFEDSDGFTYVYGAVKDGSTVRPASATTRRCVRNDKRSVRSRELRDILAE